MSACLPCITIFCLKASEKLVLNANTIGQRAVGQIVFNLRITNGSIILRVKPYNGISFVT